MGLGGKDFGLKQKKKWQNKMTLTEFMSNTADHTAKICKRTNLLLTYYDIKPNIQLPTFYRAGVVGAVGKISALRPQGPQFDPRL